MGSRVGATCPLGSILGQHRPVADNSLRGSSLRGGRQAREEVEQNGDGLDQRGSLLQQLDHAVDVPRSSASLVKPGGNHTIVVTHIVIMHAAHNWYLVHSTILPT